jgi:hypothetical protein
MANPLGPRRIWVDSGPAGPLRPGDQIIVFKVEGTRGMPSLDGSYIGTAGLQPAGTITPTTVALTNIVQLPLLSAPRYEIETGPMLGNEGSDLVGVYWALDKLGPIFEGQSVEICGDGQVFDHLRGEGRVSAKWGGKNWTPELTARIRQAETEFESVKYRTIASARNPAGNLVDEVKRRLRNDVL